MADVAFGRSTLEVRRLRPKEYSFQAGVVAGPDTECFRSAAAL